MAIFGNVAIGVIDVLAADTVLFEVPSDERYAVTGASFYNDTAGAIVVEIYNSPDDTSASGEKVDQFSVPANDSFESAAILAQGYAAGRRLIAVAAAIDVNASITVAKYTAGD